MLPPGFCHFEIPSPFKPRESFSVALSHTVYLRLQRAATTMLSKDADITFIGIAQSFNERSILCTLLITQ